MIMGVPEEFGVSEASLKEIVVASDLRSAKLPEGQILAALEQSGYDPDTIFAIKLALEEAMTNAVRHGNKGDPTKKVYVKFAVNPQRVIIMVRDEGPGFSVDAVPDCTRDENLHKTNGRGTMLIRAYMTRVVYAGAGNELWMMKKKDDPGMMD